jgi:DNA-binding transcriptional regulator GbsR (MarR family)
MNEPAARFIEDLGGFFASYGVGHALGRVFGYLLLQTEPVSLDTIAADLQMSKSAASTATRLLEQWGLARRRSERGSRRLRYEATTAIDRLFMARMAVIDGLLTTIEQGRQAARPGRAAERLAEMSQALQAFRAALQTALQQLAQGERS